MLIATEWKQLPSESSPNVLMGQEIDSEENHSLLKCLLMKHFLVVLNVSWSQKSYGDLIPVFVSFSSELCFWSTLLDLLFVFCGNYLFALHTINNCMLYEKK